MVALTCTRVQTARLAENDMHTYEHLNTLVGSGSIIFNEESEPIRQSHNLRGILNHANRRGVMRIHVDILDEGSRRPNALVSVIYRGGDIGKVYFSCGEHACEWANERSKASPRQSWFAGCEVTIKIWPANTWEAFNHA